MAFGPKTQEIQVVLEFDDLLLSICLVWSDQVYPLDGCVNVGDGIV